MKRILGVVLAAAMLLAACGNTEGEEVVTDAPIIVGHVADFSDIYSFYDAPVRSGAQLAVDEINAADGILGRQIDYRAVDGRNDQEETVRATQELIDDGVAYLIGTTGDPFLAQASLACGANIPISTGDGTAPTLVGDAGECAFQTIMSDNLQGAVSAKYALDTGYETAAILRSTEIPYTNDLPDYFAAAFENGGGTIVGDEEFRIDAGDYAVQVTALGALDPAPDVIFTPMFIPDTPVFLRQLRAAGIETPVISADGSVDASILEAGDAVEGLVATTHAWPADGNAIADFFVMYEEETGSAPDSVVIGIGYDEIYLLKQVIEAADSAEPADIMAAMSEIDGFEGVTGELSMDATTRRATKSVALVQIAGGEISFLDQFVPEFVPEVG